jgi:hypothetical protein
VRSRWPPQHWRRGPIPPGLRLGHWRRRGLHIWSPRRARSAHRPPAPASCGASGEVAVVAGEAVVFARGRGERWLRAQEGECSAGRRAPHPARGGRAAEAGAGTARSRVPEGGGARGGAARASPPPRRHRGRATRAGRGLGACRDSPFVRHGVGRGGDQRALSSPGRDGHWWEGGVDSQSGAPSPGSPAAAAAGPPPPLPPASRPQFLLAPGRRRRAEPRDRGSDNAPSRGPLAIRPGSALAPASLHLLFGFATAARPSWGRLGKPRQRGVGLQAVSHGPPLPPRGAPPPASRGSHPWQPRKAPRLQPGKDVVLLGQPQALENSKRAAWARPPRPPREKRSREAAPGTVAPEGRRNGVWKSWGTRGTCPERDPRGGPLCPGGRHRRWTNLGPPAC